MPCRPLGDDPVHADLVESERLDLGEQPALLLRGQEVGTVDETLGPFLLDHLRVRA
jgi:hypothetical protein